MISVGQESSTKGEYSSVGGITLGTQSTQEPVTRPESKYQLSYCAKFQVSLALGIKW